MSDLKKIGLIYKADGQADFVKSLKSVNSELRENYQNMQLTQASWDKNTKASEKLRDRLVNLQSAYDLNSKKITVLNEDLEALQKNENATEAEINAKKAAIKQTEAEMKRYDNRIKGVNDKLASGTVDIEQYGKKLQETGKQFENVGKKMSLFSAAYVGAMGLAVKAASDWESSWVNVLKVTDGTDKQLDDLSKSIRKMSQELPVSANEIAGVVEAASKLGVGINDVEGFAETMVKMEIATGISANESATAIARFAEITKMSFQDVERLGSVIAELGDNYATTEKEIIDMSMGLAAAGSQVGMHQSDIMALATALSSVGLEAQAGGSAMSKLMVNMELATKTGDGLIDFANVAGVSGEEFARIFETDATKAISMFIEGLDDINKDGGSAIKTLDDMGIKEVRLRDTLLRAANASDTFTNAIKDGSKAWDENSKLTSEAEIQADTLANQWKITKNMIQEIPITFGEIVMPYIKDFVEWIQKILQAFQNLSPRMQTAIVAIGGIIAVIGPLLIIIGKIIGAVGVIMANWGIIVSIFGAITAAIGFLLSPIGLLIAAIVAVAAIIYNNWELIKSWTLNLIDSLVSFFQPFVDWLVNIWTGLIEIVQTVWNTISAIISVFVDTIIDVLTIPFDFIKNTIIVIIALLAVALEIVYNTVLKPLLDIFMNIFNSIKNFIIATINSIKDIFSIGFSWIKDSVISPLVNFFSGIFTSVVNVINSAINVIKSAFSAVGNFITSIFTGIKETVTDIFSTIAGIIKAPINGIISLVNGVLKSLNKIKIPNWVPFVGGSGVNFSMIPMLAKGGNLRGSAIVGERGPELLQNTVGGSRVTPLTSSGGTAKHDLIDYREMALAITKSLTTVKLVVDEDGFARFVDDRLLEVI